MPKARIFLLFYCLAALLLGGFVCALLFGWYSSRGWLLMSGLVSLAIAIRGNPALKGLSFTLMIFGAASLSLYHPGYFTSVGDFRFSSLIVPLLQVIMFGMGTELSLKDFSQVLRMPKGIIAGVVLHYSIMPLLGFSLAKIFQFPPEIAAGLILVGCCPSGLASNVMSYLARANLALSVSVTTLSTLLAPLCTPLLLGFLGHSYVTIDFWAMAWDITKIVILPTALGLLVNQFLYGRFSWLASVMPVISMLGIILIIAVITAAGRDHLLKVGPLLILAVLIHNLGGYFLGYWSARLLQFSESDCRTIALAVGMQNSGLASGLSLSMGKLATAGLAPAIFGPAMNISGSMLASWWHGHRPQEVKSTNQEK